MIEYHTLGGLNSRNSWCHSSGGQKSEIRVLAGMTPPESSEGASIPCHSFSFCGLLAVFCLPWLVAASLNPCLYLHMAFPLCVCVFPNVPFYKDTSHVGLGAHPVLIWPCINLTCYIYNNSSSNKVTLWGPGGEEYNMQTLVDTIQCITVS